MFLKLVKHEFKATYKIFLQMILGFLLMNFITVIMLTLFKRRIGNTHSLGVLDGAVGFTIGLCVLGFIALSIVSFILLIRRFYVSMVGKGAYLSYTLPVSSYALVGAKLLVANIWTLLVQLVLFISSIFMLLVTVGSIIGNQFYSDINNFFEDIRAFSITYSEEYKAFIHFFYFFLLMLIVSNIYGIVSWYLASVVGMQVRKHKVGVMILTVIGLSFVIQMVGNILFMRENLNLLKLIEQAADNGSEDIILSILNFQKLIFLKTSVFTFILSVISFIATGLIVKHKPNIN